MNNPKRTINLLIALIVMLLGVIAYLLFTYNKTETALIASKDEQQKMEMELTDLQNDLDNASNSVNQLSDNLKEKDEELNIKIKDLQKALRSGKLTKEQLSEAKNEIDQLRYYIQKYQSEIGTLKLKNDSLARENNELNTNYTEERSKNTNLTDQNVLLSNKVAQASTLKAYDVNVLGIRFKGSGEEIEASRAKNTEKVKIDFKIVDNEITDKGIKQVYLRIMNPTGGQEVITDALESKFKADGQEMVFTTKANINFDNAKGKLYSVYWNKNSVYEKGEYRVFLYCEQRKIGESTFELR